MVTTWDDHPLPQSDQYTILIILASQWMHTAIMTICFIQTTNHYLSTFIYQHELSRSFKESIYFKILLISGG